jgi:hypothetical protein
MVREGTRAIDAPPSHVADDSVEVGGTLLGLGLDVAYEKNKVIRATLLETIAISGPHESPLLAVASPFVALQFFIFAASVTAAGPSAFRKCCGSLVLLLLFLLSLIPLYAVHGFPIASLNAVIPLCSVRYWDHSYCPCYHRCRAVLC